MRLTALDGWRGVLALFIVLAHFPGHVVLMDTSFYEGGSAIVDVFFLFSGFVIVSNYETKLANGYGSGRFLIERLGRIYPIHFVMLMMFLAFELLLVYAGHKSGYVERPPFSGGNTIPSFWSNLFLVHSLGLHDVAGWNYPSWSLSTEWATYILFALSLLLPGKRFLPFALAGFLVAPILLANVSPYPMHETYHYGILRSIYGFCGGALTYYVYARIKSAKLEERVPFAVWTVLEVVAASLIFVLPFTIGTTPYAVLMTLAFTPFILIFAIQKGGVSRLLGHKSMVYLGTISLSIYMIHAFILLRVVNVAELIQKVTGIPLVETQIFRGQPTKLVVMDPLYMNILAFSVVALVVLISHFTHRFIEVPAEKKVRQWTKARAQARVEEKPVPAPAAL